MFTKANVRGVLRHPLVIIPPLVIGLVLGWQQYTYAGRNLSLPSGANLLPAFGDFNDIPDGWQVRAGDDLSYTAKPDRGYTGGTSLSVTVNNYHSGTVTITSPKITVETNQSYLLKGYYRGTVAFALLTRYYHADGTWTTELADTFPASGTWLTASTAPRAAPDVVAVQFLYRVYSTGTLRLNAPYFEPRADVYIPPAKTGNNRIPNSVLSSDDFDTPLGWSAYHAGKNVADFVYRQDDGDPYIEIRVSDYQNGQAKWQHTPLPVQADQYYQIRLSYRSNVVTPLVAEYTLQNAERKDQTIATLPPADDWTTCQFAFQTLLDATTLFVSTPLEHDGVVASRGYVLTDISQPAPSQWRQPLVSITFDDGWRQAYQNAVPALDHYKYPATFYINPATIETPGFMRARELAALSTEGNEIAAHGYEHDDLTTVDTGTLEYQLREGRNYLQDAGFSVTNTALPYGRSDPEVQWYAHQYFVTLRGTEPGINTRQNLDPYNLRVLQVTYKTSLQDIQNALDRAKSYHGWLILSYHQISDNPSIPHGTHAEDITVTPAAFKQHTEAIHASGIQVATIAGAYQQLTEPQVVLSHKESKK